MIILMGPSASGKTSIGRILEKKYNIEKVVTYTTRDKRYQEADGIDYHFINKDEFLRLSNSKFFFETTLYNNNYYGTSFESLKNDSYMILDINGYLKYKNSNIDIMPFFLEASLESRKERMNLRKDSEENIKARLELDKDAFDVNKLDDKVCVIDTDKYTEEEIARIIYDRYTK